MKKVSIILAAAFFLFIIVIVVLADQGRLPGFVTVLVDFPNGDKVGHFLLMGGLSLLVNLALPDPLWPPAYPGDLAGGFTGIFGRGFAGLVWHPAPRPGRFGRQPGRNCLPGRTGLVVE